MEVLIPRRHAGYVPHTAPAWPPGIVLRGKTCAAEPAKARQYLQIAPLPLAKEDRRFESTLLHHTVYRFQDISENCAKNVRCDAPAIKEPSRKSLSGFFSNQRT